MFWIALELRISKMGLIAKLSLPVKLLNAFLRNGFTKSGNAAQKAAFENKILTYLKF